MPNNTMEENLINFEGRKPLSIQLNKEHLREILIEAKSGLHIRDIAAYYISRGFCDKDIDIQTLAERISGLMSADCKSKTPSFMRVSNGKNGSKKGFYKIHPSRVPKKNPTIKPPGETPTIKEEDRPSNAYKSMIGKAGECAVMSELLYREYNVNTMMVDDGVDVVASKNNMFFFIQVKTSMIRNNRISVQIKNKRFNDYLASQIRYVVVARCSVSGIDSNMFFIFNNSDIQRFIFSKTVYQSDDTINIKIRIDQNNKKPMLYHDGKEEDISFNLNMWDIVGG